MMVWKGSVRDCRAASMLVLLKEADRLVGDEAGYLVIDDTALPKKGSHSVGVAAQYASSLGKTSNCQSLVSVTLASREVPVMVGLRLFLPESRTADVERMDRARVPPERQVALTRPDLQPLLCGSDTACQGWTNRLPKPSARGH